jgi:hypothetical protein
MRKLLVLWLLLLPLLPTKGVPVMVTRPGKGKASVC